MTILCRSAALPLLLSAAGSGFGRRRAATAMMHAATPAASGSIEVERKFQPPSDAEALRKSVEAAGGEVVGEVRFTDTYFDTSACALTRRDIWLRRRDEAWELKLPVEGDARRSGGERTVFREIEGAAPVNDALRTLLPADQAGAALEETLRLADAKPFAEFATTRAKYKLGGCALDADVASFGHAVLEIEVLVSDEAEVPAAEAEIERVATLVGAQPLEKALGGKLETYIRRHAPDVLAALVEEGILQP